MIALLLALAVGSKQFTESVILGEIAVQTLAMAGLPAEHRRELGGTRVLFEALRRGDIDVYPEYTGTIEEELLRGAPAGELARLGLRQSGPLGFEDNYAVGMRRDRAQRLGARGISDLRRHPELQLGFSNEFMRRRDGWPRLREIYGLSETNVRGLEHNSILLDEIHRFSGIHKKHPLDF